MFLSLDKKVPESIAIEDSRGHIVSYRDLCGFIARFGKAVGQRGVIFVICENSAGACAGYVAAIENKQVPLLLSHTLTDDVIDNLIRIYGPTFIWAPDFMAEKYGKTAVMSELNYSLIKMSDESYPLAPELAMLLPTSGSTGSPKLVRHTRQNIEANAKAVSTAFEINESSRGLVSLPINFTQGLNVATSHLYAGGTVLLTTHTLTEREFWTFVRERSAESLTGVPYSYELLNKLHFFKMDLPALKIINQGGGRLSDNLFQTCAQYAADTGRKFIATYGSTETTSRMAYLPADWALQKTGSIGIPLPGCSLVLIDENGEEITTPHVDGEIVFHGPNVTLGYAENREDLMRGDERNGVYHTGDLAHFDEDGCFYIVGRKSRFVKLFGYRIGLDETERLIKAQFGIDCACVGTDKKMCTYITEQGNEQTIKHLLAKQTNLPQTVFDVRVIEEIPKNDSGKTMYSRLSV